ncbi:tail fiber protein [Pseudomonas phage WP1]
MISATPARLTFSQVLVQNPKPIMFRNAGDSSMIDRGAGPH